MKLTSHYDKTDFSAHMSRVINIGTLHNKVSTFHKSFNDCETDIEACQDIAISMKNDWDKCLAAGKTTQAADAEQDYLQNEELLERHNADKKKHLRNVLGLLDEYEFPKR